LEVVYGFKGLDQHLASGSLHLKLPWLTLT